MELNINYTSTIDKITSTLSIIGKRATDDNGESLYERITFSSREFPIIRDFIKSAALSVASAMGKYLVSQFDSPDAFIIVYDAPPSVTEPDTLQASAQEYITTAVLARWFGFVLPGVVDQYDKDSVLRLSDFERLLNSSRTPHAEVSVNSINTPTQPCS